MLRLSFNFKLYQTHLDINSRLLLKIECEIYFTDPTLPPTPQQHTWSHGLCFMNNTISKREMERSF